jgi:hypothetical protein
MALNVKTLGQVWTPFFIVGDMVSLIKNSGTILEPSAGAGAFSSVLDNERLTAIEYDKKLAKKIIRYIWVFSILILLISLIRLLATLPMCDIKT